MNSFVCVTLGSLAQSQPKTFQGSICLLGMVSIVNDPGHRLHPRAPISQHHNMWRGGLSSPHPTFCPPSSAEPPSSSALTGAQFAPMKCIFTSVADFLPCTKDSQGQSLFSPLAPVGVELRRGEPVACLIGAGSLSPHHPRPPC